MRKPVICPSTIIPWEIPSAPLPLAKKNWLFAGFERASQRSAAFQTLLGTANLNGIDPVAWLKDTLEKLPTWPNSRIDELLPFSIQAADINVHNVNDR